MIPGMGKMVKDLDIDNDSFKPIEAIIQSMTPKEREKPELLDANRKKADCFGQWYQHPASQQPHETV